MGDKTALDFQQLEQIAKKFQQEADELNQQLNNSKGQVENLHGSGWVGRGSDKFFEEMEQQVLPAMGRLVNAMHMTANILNNIMNVYRQAQEEASNPFKAFHV
jgi:WXG100 family type VII secretion target